MNGRDKNSFNYWDMLKKLDEDAARVQKAREGMRPCVAAGEGISTFWQDQETKSRQQPPPGQKFWPTKQQKISLTSSQSLGVFLTQPKPRHWIC